MKPARILKIISHDQRGITLIELLLVMAISVVLFGFVMADFTTFQGIQTLQQAASEYANALQTAKTKAMAQVVPADCIGGLHYYSVKILPNRTEYELDYTCGTPPIERSLIGSQQTLPAGVTFSAAPSLDDIQFDVITGYVDYGSSTDRKLVAGSSAKTVSVDHSGNITIN